MMYAPSIGHTYGQLYGAILSTDMSQYQSHSNVSRYVQGEYRPDIIDRCPNETFSEELRDEINEWLNPSGVN